MKYWQAESFVPNERNARVLRNLLDVIGVESQTAFSRGILESLGDDIGIEHCMVFRYPDNTSIQVVSGAREGNDLQGFENARPYMANMLYRLDSNWSVITNDVLAVPGNSLVHYQSLADINLSAHRALYSHSGMAERLSVLHCLPDRTWIAVNLYRSGMRGSFSANELLHVSSTASVISQAAAKHVALTQGISKASHQCSASSVSELAARIAERYPNFPRREREVMSALLRGLTADGIACELEVGTATVLTYKQRLFNRLNINTRAQLFATFFGGTPGNIHS
ncbi:helix-turn-helix transcriptional regulator [Paraburkholderia sp.]|uniref:helix-turn-helix transcriptional regulator n=1 Tax=Paraburkholderia sp. TaxID=1926495 RepID=UPI003C7AAE48